MTRTVSAASVLTHDTIVTDLALWANGAPFHESAAVARVRHLIAGMLPEYVALRTDGDVEYDPNLLTATMAVQVVEDVYERVGIRRITEDEVHRAHRSSRSGATVPMQLERPFLGATGRERP